VYVDIFLILLFLKEYQHRFSLQGEFQFKSDDTSMGYLSVYNLIITKLFYRREKKYNDPTIY